MQLKNWIQAARPKTLTASIVPIVVTTAYCWKSLESNWWLGIFALLASLFIQIACNLFNDAIDFKQGKDTAKRIGPKRITVSGEASYQSVMKMAFVFLFLAIICGLPLVITGGIPIVIIGLMSILFAYLYTGGPYPLSYIGIADIFVIFFFGIVAVGGLGYIYTASYGLDLFLLGLQIGMLCNVMLVINNLRDAKEDEETGKKTLIVRFGNNFGQIWLFTMLYLPMLIGFYWGWLDIHAAATIPLFLTTEAWRIFSFVKENEASEKYNELLGKASMYYMSFGLILAATFLQKAELNLAALGLLFLGYLKNVIINQKEKMKN